MSKYKYRTDEIYEGYDRKYLAQRVWYFDPSISIKNLSTESLYWLWRELKQNSKTEQTKENKRKKLLELMGGHIITEEYNEDMSYEELQEIWDSYQKDWWDRYNKILRGIELNADRRARELDTMRKIEKWRDKFRVVAENES